MRERYRRLTYNTGSGPVSRYFPLKAHDRRSATSEGLQNRKERRKVSESRRTSRAAIAVVRVVINVLYNTMSDAGLAFRYGAMIVSSP
jgi:hypothetical protein